MESTQFFWRFKMNMHNMGPPWPPSPIPALGALLEGEVVTRPRKMVGQGLRPLPEAVPHGCPRGTGGPWFGHKLSHSSVPRGRGGWGADETERKDTCPSRVWVAQGPQPGAGTLHTGTGAQALSRCSSDEFQGRKVRQAQAFWSSGHAVKSTHALHTPGFES